MAIKYIDANDIGKTYHDYERAGLSHLERTVLVGF